MRDPSWSNRFVDSRMDIPNYGFTDSSYWLRFTIQNPNDESKRWLLEVGYPHLDSIEVYIPSAIGEYAVQKAADLLPYNNRAIDFYKFLFPFNSEAKAEQTIYLRIKSESSMQFPLTIWDPVEFAEYSTMEKYCFGMFYGLMVAIPFIGHSPAFVMSSAFCLVFAMALIN